MSSGTCLSFEKQDCLWYNDFILNVLVESKTIQANFFCKRFCFYLHSALSAIVYSNLIKLLFSSSNCVGMNLKAETSPIPCSHLYKENKSMEIVHSRCFSAIWQAFPTWVSHYVIEHRDSEGVGKIAPNNHSLYSASGNIYLAKDGKHQSSQLQFGVKNCPMALL